MRRQPEKRRKNKKQLLAITLSLPLAACRKAGFCYMLALFLFLAEKYGSGGKSRVHIQTSRDKIFIKVQAIKPFILSHKIFKYFAYDDFYF